MVDALIQHDTKWLSPASLWPEYANDANNSDNFKRPTILRFNGDDFMAELQSLMSLHPERLSEYKAQPETWRSPMREPSAKSLLNTAQPVSQFDKTQTKLLKQKKPSLFSLSTDSDALAANQASEVASAADSSEVMPLKLYQPAQQRFYLVTASLVCRRIGLPDRIVDQAKEQKVEFVIRRLIPKNPDSITNPDVIDPDACDEFAYVLVGDQFKWQAVTPDSSNSYKTLLPAEERLPMFNLGYQDEKDKKRKLIAGFIPVSKREAYTNAAFIENANPTEDERQAELNAERRDAIAHLFNLQVAGPWKRIISMVFNEQTASSDWQDVNKVPDLAQEHDGFPNANLIAGSNLKVLREKLQTASWYLLVDLLQFLRDYLPNVYQYIDTGVEPDGISSAELDVYDALADVNIVTAGYNDEYISESYHSLSDLQSSLINGLKQLIASPNLVTELDLVEYPYDRLNENTDQDIAHWPDFLFPLADPIHEMPLPNLDSFIEEPSDSEPDTFHDQIDALLALVAAAIPTDLLSGAPEVTVPKRPKDDNTGGWFVIRCVYETPNCGPFNPALVSERTEPFKMASFYDPDAPGRPITIPMPLDISPAGLRKFNKNATFMISDMLCGKLRGARKITLGDLVLSVLPWPFHKDLPDPGGGSGCSKGGIGFGMLCSLSIPIVTICAFILLTIMVVLFDLFFRWIPYFFICLPIPGLKGKKG